MPVMRNFYVSHQWLRELKRRGRGEIVGVYFRIADDETVWVGHYNQAHQQMTAAEATTMIHSEESAEGFEVIIPRRIEPEDTFGEIDTTSPPIPEPPGKLDPGIGDVFNRQRQSVNACGPRHLCQIHGRAN